MPHLGTQEDIGEHLRRAFRDRDRWVLIGVDDRGKLAAYCLLALLLADGRPQDDLAGCTIDYLDLETRERLDARLITFPRSFLSRDDLASVISAAGFTMLPGSEDVLTLGGPPEAGRIVRGLIDTCVNGHFAPTPGVN